MIRTVLLGAALLMATVAVVANAADRGHGAQSGRDPAIHRILV